MKTDNSRPLVSVVMPVYNAARFLAQAIESVLGQTYRELELIMVDDCSSDDSMQIMRSYERQDTRIRIITNAVNCGAAGSRNEGIRAATGRYIALLDSDDYWAIDKLEKQVRLLQETGAEIAYGSVELVDARGRKLKPFMVPASTDYKEMLVRCYFICSAVVIDAELLKKHLFRTDYYHEDVLLWMELLALPVKAAGEPSVLAYYRLIPGSRSNNKLFAAKHRWKIYRGALGMSFVKAVCTFARYAFWGIIKYYM